MSGRGLLDRLAGRNAPEPRAFWSARARRPGTLAVLWGNPAYNECAGRDQWREIEAALPARREAVLDLGCGTGRLAAPLAERFASYTGVDLPAMVEEARRRAPALAHRFVAGGVQEYEPPAGEFDLVLDMACLASACTAEELPPVLRRLAAAVRPGGRLVVVDAFHRAPPLVRVCRATAGEVADLLRAEGLRIVRRGGLHCIPVRLVVAREAFARWPRLTAALYALGEGALRIAPRLLGDYQVMVAERPAAPTTGVPCTSD